MCVCVFACACVCSCGCARVGVCERVRVCACARVRVLACVRAHAGGTMMMAKQVKMFPDNSWISEWFILILTFLYSFEQINDDDGYCDKLKSDSLLLSIYLIKFFFNFVLLASQ